MMAVSGRDPATEDLPVWGGRWRAVGPKPFSGRGPCELWIVRDDRGEHRANCVLKALRLGKSLTATATQRFRTEIEITRKLALRGVDVVPVLDARIREAEDDAPSYYVMPRCETTLERESRPHAGNALYALEKTRAVAATLREAHTETIHRDIKPANILLCGDQHRPLVADFGICFVHEAERLTRTEHQTLGTDDFVAPELEGGGRIEDLTPAADVYSLGKTLYAVVAGNEVFPREKHDEPKWDLRNRWPEDFAIQHVAAVVRALVRYKATDRPCIDDVVSMLDRALANVRAGVRYTEGMYEGSGPSAEEHASLLRKKLRSLDQTGRRAFLVDATEDTERRIDDLIRKRVPSSVSAPLGEPYGELMPIAAYTADEILALAIPLLEIGDEDRLGECLSRLSRPLRLNDGRQYDPARMAYVAGVVAASVVIGGIAWRNRQSSALGGIVQRYAELAPDFAHLQVLGGSSGATGPWITSLACESRVLGSMDRPAKEEPLARALVAVHGLAALRWCGSQVTAERLAALGASEPGLLEDGVPAFPALYFFQNPPWLHELGATFLDAPAFAEEVARAALGMNAAGMRDLARRSTPALLRAGRELARKLNRSVPMRAVAGLVEWNTWTDRKDG